ncbi:MAG: TatD family hydrolase [Deltaproteobacteria bacterium]
MLIDSHAHLDMDDFDADRDDVIERAVNGGVTRVVTIGVDLASSIKAIEIAKKYHFIYATVGYHPHNADGVDAGDLEKLRALVSDPKVVAWGEIGLDFFRRHSPPEKQVKAFERQLDIASEQSLPVIIHDRDAHADLVRILKSRKRQYRGVIHCFSGNYSLAMTLIEMGFSISFPGTVTYKNAAAAQEVAGRIPLERLLVETDCPYLTPEPLRGRRNEPLYVRHTAEKIAQLRQMDFKELAHATSANAVRLFNLPETP